MNHALHVDFNLQKGWNSFEFVVAVLTLVEMILNWQSERFPLLK